MSEATALGEVSQMWPLAYEFMRLGLMSFGATNITEMERVLVAQRGWMDAKTLANGFALGQMMPGPNMLAVTYYGYAIRGLGGALLATVAFYGPTSLISAAVALLWDRYHDNPWMLAFRQALLPFGAGVMLSSVLVLARTSVQSWAGVGLAAVCFLLLTRTKLNAAVVVLVAAVFGALIGL